MPLQSFTHTLIAVYSCPMATLNYLLSKAVSKQSRWWVGLQAENSFCLGVGVREAGAETSLSSTCQLQAPDSLNATKVHCVLTQHWGRSS